jgi:hypothetical protein
VPTRPRLKNAEQLPPELSTDRPTPDELENQLKRGLKEITDRNFALAAASLRQALQELPDIAEISKHIVVTETPEGLNIELVDQDGRSMFPEGAREPYERTRAIVAKLAEAIRKFPYRLTVTGHTAATRQPPRPGFSAVRSLGRPRQRHPPHPRERGRDAEPVLYGGRARRQSAALSRGSLSCGQPPRVDHAHARGAARALRRAAVNPLVPAKAGTQSHGGNERRDPRARQT